MNTRYFSKAGPAAPRIATKTDTLNERRSAAKGIRAYCDALTQLSQRGCFGKILFYPLMGPDLLPAVHTKTIGVSFRPLVPPEIFQKQMQKNGFKLSGTELQQIHHNLVYIGLDVREDKNLVNRELISNGFSNQIGPKSILFKGIWEDFCECEYDHEYERYYKVDYPSIKAEQLLISILPFLKPGDRLILCDKDIDWVRKFVVGKEIAKMTGHQTKNAIDVASPGTVTQYFRLPQQIVVLELVDNNP